MKNNTIKQKNNEKKSKDIQALINFITPVHKTLITPIDPSSLAAVGENVEKDNFIDEVELCFKEKGKTLTQAIMYEKLLMTDLNLLDTENNHIKTDKVLGAELTGSLRKFGLFNVANVIDELIKKQKYAVQLKDVFYTKTGQKAAKVRYEEGTEIDIRELEEYKANLKKWAIKKYSEDTVIRKNRGESKRVKRSSEDAANKWLVDMVNEDLRLNYIKPDEMSEAVNRNLNSEGNYHGSPEQPDNLLGFKPNESFFYKCLKE